MSVDFNIIGAGLAGSEAALTLAREGLKLRVFEQKPKSFSPAHRLAGAAELVCSNSFKSVQLGSAHGLLKAELELLESPLLKFAYEARVPGGSALSIDRVKFSELVTRALKTHPNIEYVERSICSLSEIEGPSLISTGPLTSKALMASISKELEDDGLYFYDATSPVVSLDSLDQNEFFWASRRSDEEGDYLNLPLSKEEYNSFVADLIGSEKMEAHLPDEDLKYFEGCLPIEVLAERGPQTLAFGPLRPVGFDFSKVQKKVHAVIQFRREKAAGELLNMVGFQTRMKWPEQERVLRKLPGMTEAQFMRLGAMHRNSFINTPQHLSSTLSLKKLPHIFFAGQITGSEGYTEALATGHYVALAQLSKAFLPETTAIQSLVNYLVQSDPKYFQPMNFNFGLLPPIEQVKIKGKRSFIKKAKAARKAERSLRDLSEWLENPSNHSLENFKTMNHLPRNSLQTLRELAVST